MTFHSKTREMTDAEIAVKAGINGLIAAQGWLEGDTRYTRGEALKIVMDSRDLLEEVDARTGVRGPQVDGS